MSDLSNRILEAIQKADLSYADLEKITGYSKSALQRYATGQTKKVPIDVIEAIAIAAGVEAKTILGWDDTPTERKDKTYNMSETLTDNEKKLVSNYRKLNNLGQARADEYITDLSENPKYTVEDSKSKLADVFDDIAKELNKTTEKNTPYTKQS